jgi:ornithine lipid ester-linked acyl 2-hydroxylase
MTIHENSLAYKVMAPVVPRLLKKFENAITLVSDNRTFFRLADFQWTKEVEREFPVIRQELQTLLTQQRTMIPELKDLAESQSMIAQGEWRSFMFYVSGHKVEANCALCPETARIVKQIIPGMSSALFSVLAPGARITPHRGLFKGLLRYHLGLIVPPDFTSCAIRVGSDTHYWREGEGLVFDDTHQHEVWNNSDQTRAILLVDFARDLPFPLHQLNHVMIKLCGISPFVLEIVSKLSNRVSDVKPS